MTHPYVGKAERQFWKRELAIDDYTRLDPVADIPFTVSREDKIVTAGSCFAQHVARYLSQAGFNHLICEQAHPLIDAALAAEHGYGMFSARYGNIYTARQLRQLLERANGTFEPCAVSWPAKSGSGVVDPFRPQIQPGNFLSEAELLADRAQHFAAIRSAVSQMDVFVFTLGLTESWEDTRDGAVFPLAPGVAGGSYVSGSVRFCNYDEVETYAELKAAIEHLREINPALRIILTVSPVPLNATYEPQHVLISTTWSKAVLRLAAQKAVQAFDDVAYFPSYEIITSPHVRGRYFGADCREVTQKGVEHVMRLFMKHYTQGAARDQDSETPSEAHRHQAEMRKAIDLLCDEEAITNK